MCMIHSGRVQLCPVRLEGLPTGEKIAAVGQGRLYEQVRVAEWQTR